jgi:hypothetical protein
VQVYSHVHDGMGIMGGSTFKMGSIPLGVCDQDSSRFGGVRFKANPDRWGTSGDKLPRTYSESDHMLRGQEYSSNKKKEKARKSRSKCWPTNLAEPNHQLS